jgi:predicted metal-dependent phosphoesterase TrpH
MGGDPGAHRVKVDLHLHTSGSFDCLSDPRAVVERASSAGLDRICITDHNEIDVALALNRACPDRVIVGEEVKTAERVDIIGLYLRERIPAGTPARETCERIREQGGIVYVPHPFAGGKGGGGILDDIGDVVDAIEGFNARIHDQTLNDRAVAWARERDLPTGAGSDAHTLREIGRAWVELPAFENEPTALLAALRHGTLHGTLSSHAVHLASTWAKLRRRLPGGVPTRVSSS